MIKIHCMKLSKTNKNEKTNAQTGTASPCRFENFCHDSKTTLNFWCVNTEYFVNVLIFVLTFLLT